MTLCDLLDEVRFAGTKLCVVVEDDITSLDRYYAGQYFEIGDGWNYGSACDFTPELPEVLMEQEVLQQWAITDTETLCKGFPSATDGRDVTLIYIEESDEFDQDSFWNEENMNRATDTEYEEWPYKISREKVQKIISLHRNPVFVANAAMYMLHYGLDGVRELTEDDFNNMPTQDVDGFRLMKAIADNVEDVEELVSFLISQEIISPFGR